MSLTPEKLKAMREEYGHEEEFLTLPENWTLHRVRDLHKNMILCLDEIESIRGITKAALQDRGKAFDALNAEQEQTEILQNILNETEKVLEEIRNDAGCPAGSFGPESQVREYQDRLAVFARKCTEALSSIQKYEMRGEFKVEIDPEKMIPKNKGDS